MLPLLRILPAAGVLLSLLILVLAAMPPRGSGLPRALAPARGALIDTAVHPEWRQVILQAASRRAGEVERLRDLPDAPVRMPPRPQAATPIAPEPALTDIAPVLNVDPLPPPPSPEMLAALKPQPVAVSPVTAQPVATVPEPAKESVPHLIDESASSTSAVMLPPERPARRPAAHGKAARSKLQKKVARLGKPKRTAKPGAAQQAPPAERTGIFDLMNAH